MAFTKADASMADLPSICFVASAPITVEAFLRPHIQAAAPRFRVHVAVNSAPAGWAESIDLPATIHDVPIVRRISPAADLRALCVLLDLFRRFRFDLVHSVTPKAGLLTALAGVASNTPIRLHTFTGQVWDTRTGTFRWMLKSLDRLIAELDTLVLADSPSQRQHLVEENVVPEAASLVLGDGSICGVDTLRFRPDPVVRRRLRLDAGIPESAVLFLYIGRLRREKGVLDLLQAFRLVSRDDPRVWLALVGADEEELDQHVPEILGCSATRLVRRPWTRNPERWCAASDVLCAPSYREGFGMTVVEAAACGVPAIGSRINGLTDAIIHDQTGMTHPPGDIIALANAMRQLADSAELRMVLGENARRRVVVTFSMERVTGLQLDLYEKILSVIRAIRNRTQC